MIKLSNKYISKRSYPLNLNNENEFALFQNAIKVEIHETHLTELYNIYILNQIIVDFKKLKLYEKYCIVNKATIKYIFRALLSLVKRTSVIDNGVWIIDNWSYGCYFHWITDALPRLIASDHLHKKYPILLSNKYKHIGYVKDSLKLLNRKIIFYNQTGPVKVKKLLLPSHTSLSGNYNRLFIHEVRNQFFIKKNKKVTGKLYISRKKASRRKVINETEVENLLSSFGYQIICSEDITFQQQIELMSNIKYLVGLHGAGLTNMLFMPKESCILELRNMNDNHNNCYFSLASELNHHYYYQQCVGDTKNTYKVNITVDINTLSKNLQLMENQDK